MPVDKNVKKKLLQEVALGFQKKRSQNCLHKIFQTEKSRHESESVDKRSLTSENATVSGLIAVVGNGDQTCSPTAINAQNDCLGFGQINRRGRGTPTRDSRFI